MLQKCGSDTTRSAKDKSTLFKMSDEKQATNSPAAVVIEATQEPRAKKTKKYVIIAVSAILGAAIILAAILVGMYLFTAAQKEIVKYTLEFSQDVKQDVVSDPNTNIVQYHTTEPGHEAWIVEDFNKDIQVVKIQTEKETVCYMNALNRSIATDPSKVAKPGSTDLSGTKDSITLTYEISNTPVSDTSFLPKAARDICEGISVYWVYPHCSSNNARPPPNGIGSSPRSKRDASCASVWYIDYYGYNITCVSQCCRTICACTMYYECTLYPDGGITCAFYYQSCRPDVPESPVYEHFPDCF